MHSCCRILSLMRADIVAFVKEICEEYGLRAIHIPDARDQNDVWSITTKGGIAVSNFTTKIFYDIPPRARRKNFLPAIKRGLAHVVGERSLRETGQLEGARRMGRIIV